MSNLNVNNAEIITKSVKEGFNQFGKIREVSDIPMKTKDGESFDARGFQTDTCFVMFSKKLVDKFEGKSSVDILAAAIAKPTDYQFACKPGVTWKNGDPIWVLTTAGNNRIQRASDAQVADLNKMLGI